MFHKHHHDMENTEQQEINGQEQAQATDTETTQKPEGQQQQEQQQAPATSWLDEVGKRVGKQFKDETEFLDILKPREPELPDTIKPFYKEGKLELPDPVKELLSISTSKPEAVKEYFKLRATDPESLNGKENEKLAFVRENLDKFGGDREMAEMMFEKEYRGKYPELYQLEKLKGSGADEDDVADFEAKHAEDIALQRKLRERSELLAKTKNSEWLQTQVASYVAGQGKAPSQAEIEQAQQQLVQQHIKSVSETINAYQGFEVEGFKVGLDDKVKATLQQKALEFLPHLEEQYGFDLANGTIKDYNKFLKKLHQDIAGQLPVGEAYKQWLLEQNKEETLRGQRENPATNRANQNASTQELNEREKAAEIARAFAAKRQAQMYN